MNKSDKNKILYLLLIVMLVFSIVIIYNAQDECIEAGSFGAYNKYKNISFSDLGNNLFGDGLFGKG